MFTEKDRERLRDHVLDLARADPRVTAGAVVGSLAAGGGDRWSDLDLTFAAADGILLTELLADWTADLERNFQAVHLFDLASGPSLYRVFLLPGSLQFDLSFTPASRFGATGPAFQLLFGQTGERAFNPPPDLHELQGLAVHHLLRARFCIERGRSWQAEHWIHEARDCLLHAACLERGLPARNGRGFDALPVEVLALYQDSLPREMTRLALMAALKCLLEAASRQAGFEGPLFKTKERLEELGREWS